MSVTVIMPVHQAAAYLRAAVDSVLGQSHADLELIAVDDGSTDGSADVLATYDDPRLRVLRQENRGAAAARNAALALADREWVLWQDADDVSVPNRVELLLARTGPAGYGHSDMLLIDADGRPTGYWQAGHVEPEHALGYIATHGTPFNNPTMIVRRSLIGDTAFDPTVVVGEDTDFVARIASVAQGVHVSAPLVLYRRHGTNTSLRSYDHEDLDRLLARHDVLELVPQASWREGTVAEQDAVAAAFLAMRSWRRGAVRQAELLLAAANDLLPQVSPPVQQLVLALAQLAIGDVERANLSLAGAGGPPALLAQVRGEALALAGEPREAVACFLEALRQDPGYREPLAALRALGGAHYNLVDRPVLR